MSDTQTACCPEQQAARDTNTLAEVRINDTTSPRQDSSGSATEVAPQVPLTLDSTPTLAALLLDQHRQRLTASGISPEIIIAAGYRSVTSKEELRSLGFAPQQCRVPALLIPLHNELGEQVSYQIRPDNPRKDHHGKIIKYETPSGSSNVLHCNPILRDQLQDKAVHLFVTEGVLKADAAVSRGLCCVSLQGVWNWMSQGASLFGRRNIPLKGRKVYLAFDSDSDQNTRVKRAQQALGQDLSQRGAEISIITLLPGPDGAKVGLDDWFEQGNAAPDLLTLAARFEGLSKDGGSDLELARRWAEESRGHLAYFAGGSWMVYQDGQWRWIDLDFVRAELQHFLEAQHGAGAISSRRVEGILRLAQNHLGPHSPDILDAKPALIPLANGVYDVNADCFLPHSPDHWLTTKATYDYDPAATCPRFDRFLEESVLNVDGSPCREWIDFLDEWAGYCLIPDNRLDTVVILFGAGGNGKSVFVDTLSNLVGGAGSIAVSLKDLSNEYYRAALRGPRLGIIDDPLPRHMRDNWAIVKQVSGGSRVQARHPCGRVFDFIPHIRLMLACNELPSIPDKSDGFYRRLVLIEFRHRPVEPDPNLRDSLRGELSGIFNRALRGLRRLRERGRFPVLPESQRLGEEYRQDEDPLRRFIAEECETGPEFTIRPDSFYVAFCLWRGHEGYTETCTRNKVGRDLTRMGIPVVQDASHTQHMRQGLRIRPNSRWYRRDEGEPLGLPEGLASWPVNNGAAGPDDLQRGSGILDDSAGYQL